MHSTPPPSPLLQALLEETRADTRTDPLFHSAAKFILNNADFTQLLAFVENACSLLSASAPHRESAPTQRLRHLCSSVFVLLTYLGASDPSPSHILQPFCSGFHSTNPRGRTQAAVARWEAFVAEKWRGIVSIEIRRERCLCKVIAVARACFSRGG